MHNQHTTKHELLCYLEDRERHVGTCECTMNNNFIISFHIRQKHILENTEMKGCKINELFVPRQTLEYETFLQIGEMTWKSI